MKVLVATDRVELTEVSDLAAFSVVSDLDSPTLTHALATAGAGRVQNQYVWININWILNQAACADPDWMDAFDQMLAYAKLRGWLLPGTGQLRAHITRTQHPGPESLHAGPRANRRC